MADIYKTHTFLSAAAADGAGTELDVSQLSYITIGVATASSANGTVTFYAAAKDVADWDDAQVGQEVTNHFELLYATPTNYNTADATNGVTAVACSGTDKFELVRADVRALKKVNVILSSYSAGAFTAYAYGQK